jgi:hypothetical protein
MISDRKNLGAGSGFALGALLGIFGLIIVACQKPDLPPAPVGMRSVKCTRCNAVQKHPSGSGAVRMLAVQDGDSSALAVRHWESDRAATAEA